MRIASVLAAAAIAVTCGPGGVLAQSSSDKTIPAEFPPASYTGRQYVDSEGCVFIRAGIDGNVTWVPRMTRGRQHICGFQPTFSALTPAVTAETSATAPATPAPKPALAQVAVPAESTPPPKPVVAIVPASSPHSVASGPCTNRSTNSLKYINSSDTLSIRCGPQAQPHVIHKVRPSSSPTYNSGTQVRVAPKHVYESQVASREGIYVPEGYQPVWEDDRLNPYRAHQTLAGKAQMDMVWTNTVPRRLIRRPAGQVVSKSSGGIHTPVVTRSAPVVSTRSAPLSKPSKLSGSETRAASHRYVQVGAFMDADHAKRTAQKIANSGIPVKMGSVRRDGKSYTMVLAGPFSTQAQLDHGLNFVRGIGFTRASLRK